MNAYREKAKQEARKRRQRIVKLRDAGRTQQWIADRLGISRQLVSVLEARGRAEK